MDSNLIQRRRKKHIRIQESQDITPPCNAVSGSSCLYSTCCFFLYKAALNRIVDRDPWFTAWHRWMTFDPQENINNTQLSYKLINASYAETLKENKSWCMSHDMSLGWDSLARLSLRFNPHETVQQVRVDWLHISLMCSLLK